MPSRLPGEGFSGFDPSYISGTPIVSSAIFDGTSLATLGFTASGLIGTWQLVGVDGDAGRIEPRVAASALPAQRRSSELQAAGIQRPERTLGSLRQAVASATSSAELNQQLQALQGPVLGSADLAQPLPLLKTQVRAVLQQAEQEIERERQQAAPVSPWLLLPDLLRNAVAFLALAIGFATPARRPGQPITLRQEGRFRRDLRLQRRLRHRAAASTDQEFVRQMFRMDDQG